MDNHIDKTIARISSMTTNERDGWLTKANRVLEVKPTDIDAKRLKSVLLDAPLPAEKESWKCTGSINWESGGKNRPICHGYVDGKPIARITKTNTHTLSRKNVYVVSVFENQLAGMFRHIGDARMAGEKYFQGL